jgi:cysteine desulfurase
MDEAHERVARCIGGEAREIVFTSGGTEAINLAIKGAAWAGKARGARIVTTAVEHHAALHAVEHLERFGFEAVYLPVDRYGRVDPEQLAAAVTEKTVLVTLMVANNEVGTVQPIEEIVRRVRTQPGVLIHLDAVQAAPYVPIDVRELDVDLVSLGAHKFEGPKGMGALWMRHGTTILPQQHGGSQERYRRAGTENVAGAVGLATAFELCVRERPETVERLRRQRERLQAACLAVPGVELTGHPRDRLPGLLSIVVRDLDGGSLQLSLDLDGICTSTGSACTSGSTEPSHVLAAMGYPDEEARGALRMSLGRSTTDADVDEAARVIPGAIVRLRPGSAAVAADPLGQGVIA